MSEIGPECPKCGNNRWRGPIFIDAVLNKNGRESLMFTCTRCGYDRHEFTLEQIKTHYDEEDWPKEVKA